MQQDSPQQKQPPRFAQNIFMLFIAVAAGFFGGYYGSRVDDSAPSSSASTNVAIQREVIDSESDLISSIAKEVGQSVVSVNVKSVAVQQDFFGFFSDELEQESAGTGVILSDDGLIITNRHVVPRDASSVSITLSDGTELRNVDVVGRTNDSDPLDIAFLKVTDTEGKELKPAVIGDSSATEVGDRVIAIGNALGQFQNTVTTGILSGFGRDIEAFDGSGVDSLENLFQTDAAINGGNSGGPLVNTAGEVIGINVATAQAENISFSIPINDVKGLIDTVLAEGELIRPYLGIRYVTITDDIAFDLSLSVNRGAYIPRGSLRNPAILPDSPAEKAGLQPEDIIVSIDGTNLDEDNSVVSVLGQKRVGDTIDMSILRDGNEQTVQVILEASPDQ